MKKFFKKFSVKALRIATNGNTYITLTFTLFLMLPEVVSAEAAVIVYGSLFPAMILAMIYTIARRELNLQTHQVGVYLTITGMKYYLLSLPGQTFIGAPIGLDIQLFVLGVSLALAGLYFIQTAVKDFKAIRGTAAIGMIGLLFTVTKFIL